ncbi:hypothetical protein PENARI_c016G04614 [Penicillium arizonense]|uniref:Mitochondrial inner membrane protease subunit n=1 Tax=Penicillium arizonense TaxID=1835702 RepID=A0A1F5LCA4_PENAI|nr:hypothetical protein PENARI_c016G04614 [Penicillium arizonense]OGE50717.1 hypothetical protein PENARI_c016G04614 [Penicillium arizonense]
MTKPQPRNRAAPTPNPRFRVKPQEAPTPKAAEPPAAAPGPALIKPKRRPFFQTSLLTNLRQRFANLPSPVRRTCRTLRWLAPVIPIGLFFPEHVMQVMWVRGPSMTPYLNEDYDQMQTKSDMVLVNMWSWGGLLPFRKERKLERGTVVTFRSPANPSHIAIKRIIGLPGDRVTTREPCLKETQIVPWNHVWLEGDAEDPRKTLDSNTYGPVSLSLVTGRVFAVLGPRMRWLNASDWEEGGDGDANSRVERHRQSVRDRVVKNAVKVEQPFLN